MELSDLIGEHILSGVDYGEQSVLQYGDRYEDCEVVNFVLDGKTYTAVEDPGDGYRSSMRDILESDVVVTNNFPGVRVFCKMRDKSRYGEVNDILELYDIFTGKLVLAVGTENTDDYYPMWVSEWNPENMITNEGRANA